MAVRISRQLAALSASLLIGGAVVAEDFEATLERARQAAVEHHYEEAIELLVPFRSVREPEIQYIVAAESGRAFFHLGRYQEAHSAFRQAVRLFPTRVESAIYLLATSYLLDDRDQAYEILRAILDSGARDLYLVMTLPGERRFAADPDVQAIIEEFTVPLEINTDAAQILGVQLGDDRATVVETTGARSSDPSASTLTAAAGPALIWGFVFDANQQLEEVVVQAENLLRYTPYRLRLGDDLTWMATPAAAIAAWGAPDQSSPPSEEGISMTWERSGSRIIVDFGLPRDPRPKGTSEGSAMIKMIRLERLNLESAGRIAE